MTEKKIKKYIEAFESLDRQLVNGSVHRSFIDSCFSRLGGIKGAKKRLKQELPKRVEEISIF